MALCEGIEHCHGEHAVTRLVTVVDGCWFNKVSLFSCSVENKTSLGYSNKLVHTVHIHAHSSKYIHVHIQGSIFVYTHYVHILATKQK